MSTTTSTQKRRFEGPIGRGPNFGFENVTVSKLLIHPIKSCKGTSLQHSRYYEGGLENDRRWCILDASTHTVLTAREIPKMVLITPKVEVDPNASYGGVLRVEFPKDEGIDPLLIPLRPTPEMLKSWTLIEDITLHSHSQLDGYICKALPLNPNEESGPSPSEVISRFMGKEVNLIWKGPKRRPCDPTSTFPDLQAATDYADGYPLLVLSEESVRAVEEVLRLHVGTQGIEECWKTDELIIERFRPNIIFKGGGAFAEDVWQEISILPREETSAQAPGILLVSKCARCRLPNVCPYTGIPDKAVPLKILMKCRTGIDPNPKKRWEAYLGCNGVPLGSGEIRVGDRVLIRKVDVP